MSIDTVLVVSKEDMASCNIKNFLLKMGSWQEHDDYEGAPAYVLGTTIMVTIESIHLYYDDIDKKVEDKLGIKSRLVIFASRHRSESGLKTLTIHPLGNFTEAKFGGIPGRLVPTAPRKMTQALRILKEEGAGLEHQITFESTHHGPFLSTPTFFIEIGSDESAWVEEPPAEVISKTLLRVLDEPADENDRIAIGIGGGHYAPRFSEVTNTHRIVFGHMVPNYAVDMPEEMYRATLTATPGVDCVYFHRKSMKKQKYRELAEWFENDVGVQVVKSRDLKMHSEQ